MARLIFNQFQEDGLIHEDYYIDFLRSLRNAFSRGVTVNGKPRIDPAHPESILDVQCFRAGDEEARLLLRFNTADLFLIGFRSVNEDNWWEMPHSGLNIPGSEKLPFDTSYLQLHRVSGTKFGNITINPFAVDDAILTLSSYHSNRNTKRAAKSILVFVILFAEAARFSLISDFIHRNHLTGADMGLIQEWAFPLVHKWGDLSNIYIEAYTQEVDALAA
ncbi:unnamed protein product [Cuscuta epithymum]|uniref:rRNA N-glycosylase n=1 Tax=Cuscuta epithymum TaxID=186058 RepID=A0AAV0CSM0_9ASTE|nr:unnamed protein product [Cuscuta epithymum]